MARSLNFSQTNIERLVQHTKCLFSVEPHISRGQMRLVNTTRPGQAQVQHVVSRCFPYRQRAGSVRALQLWSYKIILRRTVLAGLAHLIMAGWDRLDASFPLHHRSTSHGNNLVFSFQNIILDTRCLFLMGTLTELLTSNQP